MHQKKIIYIKKIKKLENSKDNNKKENEKSSIFSKNTKNDEDSDEPKIINSQDIKLN